MSLVVLRRKSQTKYSKISAHKGFFSLNNPRRVDSHRNQTQTQTPMKGSVPRGHGTCCGKYPIVINKSSYINYDPSVRSDSEGKSNTGISVKNNRASISTRNKWIKRGYPHYIVQDVNPMSSQEYSRKLSAREGGENYGRNAKLLACNDNKCPKSEVDVNIVKRTDTLDYSEYLKTKFLKKKCQILNGLCN